MTNGDVPGAKRIAIVYRNLASLSGTPNTIFAHAKYLARLGYEVDLVAEKIDRTRLDGPGVGTVRIRRLPLFKSRRLASFARRADARVRTGYDFVAGHGHHGRQAVVSLHNCARLAHLKARGSESTGSDPNVLFQDRLFTERRFRLCIANSALMRDELVRRYGVPADEIRVIYPGYDPARFDPGDRVVYRDATRRELEIEPGDCLIGIVTSGNFAVRGVDLGIEAFAALTPKLRERSHLVIIGRASSTQTYRTQIERLGLERRIRFLRPVHDIERYYHALDICLHPARFEEFGQSVQEAMACGLPVVTNRQVGAVELLPEAARAEVPEESTVPGIVARLEPLIEDAQARGRWGELGREAVEGNTLEANCERTVEVYREAGL